MSLLYDTDSRSSRSANHVHSPFPFLKLPAEVRNKIYELTATTYHSGRLGNYIKAPSKWYKSRYRSGQETIVQPGLVCCSKQTRSEGLLIFFHNHHFVFKPQRWGPQPCRPLLDGLLPWLDRIGAVGRTHIRHMELVGDLRPPDVPAMDRLHARLSDEATVLYQSQAASGWLWDLPTTLRIVHTFQLQNPGKVPVYEIQQITNRQQIDSIHLCHEEIVYSLEFLPGLLWFGRKLEVCASDNQRRAGWNAKC